MFVNLQKVISRKTWKKKFFVGVLKANDENSRIRIWIRTKISRIRNIDVRYYLKCDPDLKVRFRSRSDLNRYGK
jgi:hypothetical protein